MFTGVVEETGPVRGVTETDDGIRLEIGTSFPDLEVGQSVSVSGACLTVEAVGEDDDGPWFVVFLAEETRERTYLGELTTGERVNLERAMPATGRFDGHLVQGHVDGTGEVLAMDDVGEDWRLRVAVPPELGRYVVAKGSLAIDGISLTVASVDDGAAEFAIVPETYRLTTLSDVTPGDFVHLEVDVVAKYVESLLTENQAEIWSEFGKSP
ncbi:MAG: riboflavin synthase [Salinirussus sp.]